MPSFPTGSEDDADEKILQASQKAIALRGQAAEQLSDLITLSSALTMQWFDLNVKAMERASQRLTNTKQEIQGRSESDAHGVSYHEQSEIYQQTSLENAKDYYQQLEKFSLSAAVIMERMAKKYTPK